MKVEYMGDGKYIGTLHRHNGASVLYGRDREDIIMSLIEAAFPEKENDEPTFRVDEEAWTDDDWERDFRRTEEYYKHKDDDNV